MKKFILSVVFVALFIFLIMLGFAAFAVALLIAPVIYLWVKWKTRDLKPQQHETRQNTVIDVEYEIIDEEKGKD